MSDTVKIDSSSLDRSISTATGVAAAQWVRQIADENNVEIALAGGIAMHVYGFTRATTDVDMIADAVLPLSSRKTLSFGGENYGVDVEGTEVSVDVIVRNDELASIYAASLADAPTTERGIRIISPEWLVVMKFFSARAKDKLDLLWLLQQDGLVDRAKIEQNLVAAVGKQSAFFIFNDLQSEFSYSDFLLAREKDKYGEISK